MDRRKNAVSSRDRGHRLLRWLLLVTAGLGGGLLLGEMTVQNLRGRMAVDRASYSEFSANPDASMPAALPQDACLNCPDSYGVAARMRAAREARADGAFRDLGAVETDPPPLDEPIDEYHYGGRFPDASPIAEEEMPIDVPAPDGVAPAFEDAPPQ